MTTAAAGVAVASAAALAAALGGGAHPSLESSTREGCLTCHQAVVAHAVLHGPAAAGPCSSCHRVDGDLSRPAITLAGIGPGGDLTGLCLRCHDETREKLEEPHRHGPVKGGLCTTCHDPHGSAFPYQLNDLPRGSCLRCHREVAEILALAFPHRPAISSCASCHDPHASRAPAQLRQPLNKLCLRCHAENAGAIENAEGERQLATAAAAATPPSARRVHLDDGFTRGHPIGNHPVEGMPDPLEPRKPLTCASCHNPHGGPTRQLFRFAAGSVSALCIRCHAF